MKSWNLWISRAAIVLISLVCVLPAWAERVLPNERVKTTLLVREQPQVESTIVSSLSPNQSAEYIESIPYWFHIRLDDGTTGYVSQAWSEKASDILESGGLIRIGSWNLKKLGHANGKDFDTVARIIDANFDLVAVIEVMQKGGTHPGYEDLLTALGPGWTGLVTESPRPNTNSGNAEYYAVLYRPALISTCPGWNHLIYYADNDGSPTGTGEDIFSREPAFGCFQAPNNSAVGFDFLLAGYHARWEGGNKREIKAEVAVLKKVFQAMGESRVGEKDLIITGDFNLDTEDLQEVLSISQGTTASGSTLNSGGEITSNVYDHILVDDLSATQEMIDSPQIINATSTVADGEQFYSRVSDHLPVAAWFRTFGLDDD